MAAACLRAQFAPQTERAAERALFSDESVWSFDRRKTHKYHTLREFVKEGADKFVDVSGARRFATTTIGVEAFGERSYFDVAAVKNWHAALQRCVEERHGVRCSHLALGDTPLGEFSAPSQCAPSSPLGVPVVRIVGVVRGEERHARAGAGAAVAWPDFERRVMARVMERLPAALAALPAASADDTRSPAQRALDFVSNRATLEPLVRAVLADPTLALAYAPLGADAADSGSGDAHWFGAELAGAEHAVSRATADAARAAFDAAHALAPGELDKMANTLALECYNALGDQLEAVADSAVDVPLDAGAMRAQMRNHFAALGAEAGDGGAGFALSADRCACTLGKAQKRERKRALAAAQGRAAPRDVEEAPMTPPAAPVGAEAGVDAMRAPQRFTVGSRVQRAGLLGASGGTVKAVRNDGHEKTYATEWHYVVDFDDGTSDSWLADSNLVSATTSFGAEAADDAAHESRARRERRSARRARDPFAGVAPAGSLATGTPTQPTPSAGIGADADYCKMPPLVSREEAERIRERARRKALRERTPEDTTPPASEFVYVPDGEPTVRTVRPRRKLPSEEAPAPGTLDAEATMLVPLRARASPVPELVPFVRAPAAAKTAAAPAGPTTIANIAPFLRDYANARGYEKLVALVPSDHVFTAAHAARLAALSDDERANELANYVAVDPGTRIVAGTPYQLEMHSGKTLALMRTGNTLSFAQGTAGVSNPAIVAQSKQIAPNVTAFVHHNLLG